MVVSVPDVKNVEARQYVNTDAGVRNAKIVEVLPYVNMTIKGAL